MSPPVSPTSEGWSYRDELDATERIGWEAREKEDTPSPEVERLG